MVRYAFTMKLQPGALAEYRKLHDEIWPELQEEIARCGILTMTIFESNPNLFLYSEAESEEAWERLRNSEVHLRWGQALRHLFVLKPDGSVDIGDLNDIFHIPRPE